MSEVRAGQVWKHSKTGNLYTVLHVGIYCGKHGFTDGVRGFDEKPVGFPEGTELVVYVGHYDNPRGNHIYMRPLLEWCERIVLTIKDGYPGGRVIPSRFTLYSAPK